MSLSRRNWSALSSLARQWTMEDEEEVEREKRRRVKSSSTNADQEDDSSPTPTPKTTSASDSAFGTDSSSETSQSSNSMEQVQVDFVEMLRVRDERRRMRHVETLRQQKEEGEDEAEVSKEGGARVELLGDMGEEKESVVKPQPPVKTSSHSPTSTSTSTSTTSSKSRTSISSKKHENEESSGKDPDPKPSSSPARKFVSSVSISLDKSPSVSGRTTPMSPGSPSAPWSPREHWTSPCQSPSPRGAQSPVQNGHTEETGVNSSTSGNSEQANKPAFIRQSSRTVSFRMMRKKEEDPSPLQRSSSVRMASKKFESSTQDQNEEENKASSFQRNSRQRISSRSIQEKMEKLAQAAQKSELTRFPDVTQRTLVLLEEVSRKRELFEKEQQVQSPTSPGVSKQEIRGLTSGMSERINRWLNKSNKAGSSHSPADLRHVDISSKRSLFENSGEDSVSKASPGKI